MLACMQEDPATEEAVDVLVQWREDAEMVLRQAREAAEEVSSAFVARFKQAVARELEKHPEATREVKRVLRELQTSLSQR